MSRDHQTSNEGRRASTTWTQLDRRRFLIGISRGLVVAAVALVIDQVVQFLSFEPPSANTSVIPLGRAKDYVNGALNYVEEARAYIGHDERGLYALDAVCTHLGCLVEKDKKGGFKCPCHGSRFDATGQPKTGPATKALRYMNLWLDEDGQLVVDRAEAVDSTTRVIL